MSRIEDQPALFDTSTWDDPVPFAETQPPPFPVGCLPTWVGRFVSDEARATQTPSDLGAILALVVAGSCIAKKYVVEPRSGWSEQPNLFGIVALPPGSRKSAVFRDISAPLAAWEREKGEEMKADVMKAKIRRRVLEKAADVSEKIASESPTEWNIEQAIAKRTEAEEVEIPELPRVMVDDVTPEKLVNLLFRHNGRMAILSPEGGVFERLSGKSASGTDVVEVALKAHAGDDIRLDRLSRGEEMIESPALSIGVAVQPDMVRGLSSRNGFRGRGLIARFLYSMPKCNIGERETGTAGVAEDVRDYYSCMIHELLHLPDECKKIVFSDAAKTRFASFERWVEPRLAPGGELHEMCDWGSKLPGAAARLAGILHACKMVESGVDPADHEVSEETVEAAVRIAWYFVRHARIAWDEMAFGTIHDNAKAILAWLRESGVRTASKREVFRAISGRVRKAEEVEEPLKELVERGFLRQRLVGAGLKRTATVYDVNPKIKGGKDGRDGGSQGEVQAAGGEPSGQPEGHAVGEPGGEQGTEGAEAA